MEEARKIDRCRACDSHYMSPIISLGDLYVTNFVDTVGQQGPKVPLNLVLCDQEKGGCGLMQLEHTTPAGAMWGDQYWYKSGLNPLIRQDLQSIVEGVGARVSLNEGDLVVDIGCNDGTLLSNYSSRVHRAGFDPSKNVAAEAKAKGFDVVNDFFNGTAYASKFGDLKAKVITAISMFYDLDDPNAFLKDVKNNLNKEGLFVVQQNYVATMLSNNAVDNICHEHLEYYSLRSMEALLARHDLEVFDVEQNGINGGSIRTYIRSKGSNVGTGADAIRRVADLRTAEKLQGLEKKETYERFAEDVQVQRGRLLEFITEEKAMGKRFGACGASTRGNTTLQYFGLTPNEIEAIADSNPDKWGKKTVGSMIPIVSPEEMKKMNPDYQLVLIWHLFKGLTDTERTFKERGGKFVLPLPKFAVI
ncbi:MAG: methyltransferase domain-containing protein [archaeon]